MDARHNKKVILEKIRTGQITPEEGYQLLYSYFEAAAVENAKEKKHQLSEIRSTDIAVIGISGRFAGAENIFQLWGNLAAGTDSITEIPNYRWNMEKYYHPSSAPNKSYSKWAGLLSDIEHFDPLFFKIAPKEAEMMDPQHKLFLEESWRALEDAGYPPSTLSSKRFGVFVGVLPNGYELNLKASGKELDSNMLTGMGCAYLPGRVSYCLNLTGPCMAIDTACSSSLVAVHQACQSLRSGESEMALAGGVNILVSPEIHIMTSQGGMLAKDGKCKTFDDSADGFVPGEAVCAVVLKPMEKAVHDGDYIYGVIKGSGINQDGKTNGLTAPSRQAQCNLETYVYDMYGIDPAVITYVEAHGTGTKLGDPIEVSALTEAFRKYTVKRQYCAIGSVKTNIGHTLAAAGIAGLIKVLLCMKYKTLVPSLHFNRENEHLNLKESPFFVNTEKRQWNTAGEERRTAALSSFGLSGTNCHMVIQEWCNE
ncbi:type I polyketide synthase [Paenibacillus alvei]|uniref:type I polyketide synthase n=1 Tax=Paenibacillus alvei TaxID=44250 RepID=UPI00227ECF0C|nr:polyketide synthase [Paenibacillus alvei]